MKIETKLLNVNKYSRPGTKRYKTTKIAWHYVGNAGSSAIANRNYFNNAPNHKTYASSHYIIGLNGEIIQCVPENEIAYTTNDANNYSIGIEMCHPDNSGKFNTNTYNAAVELGVDLCKRYKLDPLKDFIRHFDVTKKICPKYWVDNPKEWDKFKQDVKNKMSGGNNMQVRDIKIKVDGKYHTVKGIFVEGTNYIKVRELEKAGFKIGFENEVATIESPCCCKK